MVARILVFVAFSVANAAHSWRWLANPRVHGFYRFFAFESLCALVIIQSTHWFTDPFALQQLLSWFLLAGSLLLAIHGFWLLHVLGRPTGGFEHTTILVNTGAYQYIRHPLYCSLLLGAIGATLKDLSVTAIVLNVVTIALIVLTALVEERENLERFGEAYVSYRARTWMFVPWFF